MLSPRYLHPTGQIPAYEWNFSDVNPPVHALATLLVHRLDAALRGRRRRRPRLPEGLVRQAGDELHVVGQPQGPVGTQRLRRWIPRARQHRRVRSEHAAADRRTAGAGRRHGVDGPVHPEHARAVDDARRPRPDLRRLRAAVRPTVLLDRRTRSTRSAATPTRSGTTRTASSTTCSDSPTGPVRRLKVRSLVGLLPMCATTVISAGTLARFPDLHAALADQLRRNRDLLGTIADPLAARRRRAPHPVARQRGQAPAHPRADARRGAVPRPARHSLGVEGAPRRAVRVRRRRP